MTAINDATQAGVVLVTAWLALHPCRGEEDAADAREVRRLVVLCFRMMMCELRLDSSAANSRTTWLEDASAVADGMHALMATALTDPTKRRFTRRARAIAPDALTTAAQAVAAAATAAATDAAGAQSTRGPPQRRQMSNS